MRRKRFVLSVDIGTTRTKGVILDSKAQQVIASSIKHADEGSSLGEHEQNAEDIWWGEFVRVVHAMLNESGISPQSIECICVTGMYPCFCPTDGRGVPLCNALLYDDCRVFHLAQQTRSFEQYSFKGNELLARFLWFRHTYPELQQQVRYVFSTHSFIVFRLSGKYCIDSHTARSFGSIFNPFNFSWNKQELQRAHVEESLLPEILPPASIAGYVTEVAARQTGLVSGIPVVVGTGDIFASIIGSGACRPGDLMIHYGSSGSLIQLLQERNFLLRASSYPNDHDGIRWVVDLPRASKQLDWLCGILNVYGHKRDTYDILRDLDAQINTGKPAEHPIIFLHDTQKVRFPVTPPLSGFFAIPLNATPSDLHRSILESFGYSMRYGVETNGLVDVQKPWYVSGGGMQSSAWCQITSDITQRSQLICQGAEGAVGGALIAGDAVSLFDLENIVEERVLSAKVIHPQIHIEKEYNKSYNRSLQIRQNIQNIDNKL